MSNRLLKIHKEYLESTHGQTYKPMKVKCTDNTIYFNCFVKINNNYV